MGPNGAGKTTCFYMITGLIPVDTGSIFLDGHDITACRCTGARGLGIGYLPQEASIFRGLTVEQNIMAVAELVERDSQKRRQLVDDLLAEFAIDHLRRAPALALSGGERRRVEIARALATQPSFMLLDEPFAGIDPIAIGEIRELVQHLKDRGIGVLITDHNVRETLEIIDRAYIIHDGEVLIEGTPARDRVEHGRAPGLSRREVLALTARRLMALTQRLELRQGQSLVMTPQLQQAIKLLQLSNLELQAFVEQELERNPLLERDESAPGRAKSSPNRRPRRKPKRRLTLQRERAAGRRLGRPRYRLRQRLWRGFRVRPRRRDRRRQRTVVLVGRARRRALRRRRRDCRSSRR